MSDDTNATDSSPREARVNRDPSGDPLGVMVFLTARELRDLGADLDTNRLPYTVVDGRFQVGREGDDADDLETDAGR